jgi:hypothetical protein
MTLFNILIADKSPESTRIRLAALCIVLLMAGCAFGEKAHAAVACGLKGTHQVAITQCRAHAPRAEDAATQAPVEADASGARLTPLSPTAAPVRSGLFAAAPVALMPTPRQNSDAQAAFRALPRDQRSVSAGVWQARGALGNAMQDGPTPAISADLLSSPFAWTIFLAGLLGLFAMTRGRTVARAQAWGAVETARRTSATSMLDRLDVALSAPSPSQRAHQGHFVRTAAAGRFG